MNAIGALYTMRQTAELIGHTDRRTVQQEVYKLGISHSIAGKSIVINDEGLAILRRHYRSMRHVAKSA